MTPPLCSSLILFLSSCSACAQYLRLCILEFQSFRCETLPDPPSSTASNAVVTYSSYLSEDGQTKCFGLAHSALFAATVTLMLGYTIGFPCVCFVLLTRTFGTEATGGIVGWLWWRYPFLRGPADKGFVDPKRVASSSPTAAAAPASPLSPRSKGNAERAMEQRLYEEHQRTFGFLFMDCLLYTSPSPRD